MPFIFGVIMKNYLEAKNLCYAYYKEPLCLKDVSFSLNKGEKLLVLGGDGMGKTTLLKTLSGFDDKFFGDVLFEGISVKNIMDKDKGFSIIFEEPVLARGSVEKNIDLACDVLCTKKDKTEKELLLKDFAFEQDLKTKVKKLSHVEKLKVNFARVEIKKPRVLFVDDIFKNVNPEDFEEMFGLFDRICAGTTVVFVCSNKTLKKHHQIIKLFNANKVLYLNNAKGSVFNGFSEFIDKRVDLAVIGYTDEFKVIEGACFLQNGAYFFVDHTGLQVKLDKQFNKKLDEMKIDEIEGVDTVFVLNKEFNIDLANNNDVNKALAEGKLELFFKLDGSRII